MGLHMQQNHDLHDFDFLTAPGSDGTYLLEMTKTGTTYAYEYVEKEDKSTDHYTLFSHYTDASNTGTTENDLYSDTVAAGQLSDDGDVIRFTYSGVTAANGNWKEAKVYFAGMQIGGTTAIAANDNAFTISGSLMKTGEGSIVYECVTTIAQIGNAVYGGELTELTLSNSQILKITGNSNTQANDITVKTGKVSFEPA